MDIQMPDLTGLQLSKIVKGKTNIILRPPTLICAKAMKLMRLIIYSFEFERFMSSFKSEKIVVNLKQKQFKKS
jgi:hypothetical protein